MRDELDSFLRYRGSPCKGGRACCGNSVGSDFTFRVANPKLVVESLFTPIGTRVSLAASSLPVAVMGL